jgi:hypothetical protein
MRHTALLVAFGLVEAASLTGTTGKRVNGQFRPIIVGIGF